MGFATGFTGGVTLTLSIAYFTVAAHQRNRQQQCAALRANTNVLRALTLSNPAAAAQLAEQTGAAAAADPVVDPVATPSALYYYYNAPVVPAPPRHHLVDELKDRWNAEVTGAVRKVQTTNWVAVRESAEDTLAQLWTRAFGSGTPAGDAASAVKERVAAAAETAKTEAAAGAKSLQATASQALQRGKDALGVVDAPAPTQSSDTPDEVKKALQQRFKAKSDPLVETKSVNALLEERYRHKA